MGSETRQSVQVEWRSREVPLEPSAVVAIGPTAQILARRVLALDDQRLSELRAIAGESILILFGKSEFLPWVPEVRYLGQDPQAPLLLVPTESVPTVPLDLLERALQRRFPTISPPWVVLALEARVVSASLARSIDRDCLRIWVGKAD